MELPGYLSQSRMARSHDSFICMFLRNLCTDFHSGFINLYPSQQWVGVLFSPYPPQHFLLVFLMTAILTRVRDYLKVVLICMSPLTKDVDHFPKRFLESVFLLSKTACSFPQFTCRLAVLLPWHLIPAAPCQFWILASVCRWSGFSPISWALCVPWC